MVDATFIAVIVGFAALLFTVLWSERRQDRRFDRQDTRFDRQDTRFDRQDERLSAIELGLVELRTELKSVGERIDKHDEQFEHLQGEMKSLVSKVDRMQGTLDVLVFGERGVPPPVARERAEAEERVEETVGD